MQWAITLGRISGIAVRIHVTFLLFVVWIAVNNFATGGTVAAVQSVLFILAIFGSVLIHEFGHAIAARRFGVRTPDITLLPIGGVARLERMPEKPRHELIVAIAGPATNVAIAAGLYLILLATGRSGVMNDLSILTGGVLSRTLVVNVWLVLFNLLPAFPMDGGRILRAFLAERMDFVRATQISAGVGQGFAFLFALFGFFYNPLLIFIALFVYLGASGEVSTAQVRGFAQGVPVASVMVTHFRTLHTSEKLEEAVNALLDGSQREFPVIGDDGSVQGILCREDIIRALATGGMDTPVGRAMQTDVSPIHQNEMLEGAFEKVMSDGRTAIPVIDRSGALVGLLTRDNLTEVMMVKNAITSHRQRS